MYRYKNLFFFSGVGVMLAGTLGFVWFDNRPTTYIKEELAGNTIGDVKNNLLVKEQEKLEEPPIYLPTPEPLKAIYMTSWVAGTPTWRSDLIRFVEESEINAIIIDIKDYTGTISFKVDDEVINSYGSAEERIPDIKAFVRELNEKNIYVIGRISVFQDPYMAKKRPDLAVKRGDGVVWKDRKGISWIDPGAKEYWDYTVRIARAAFDADFDELNFDYIRFPSDGNMKDIAYDHWDEATSRSEIIKTFFAYLDSELSSLHVPLSADLFGMTTTNYDDLNIGQVLENAIPYFDYIAPMVYPSHYPPTFIGLANPAAHPYEVVYYSMSKARDRVIAASSTPAKLRPWIQDFDLGATYDAGMIQKQKQAVYDAGLTSWMAWDPANKYTREAYR